MIGKVKVDKLCFGTSRIDKSLIQKVEAVIVKYYGQEALTSNEPKKYGKLYRNVTPTKQLREGYDGFNHNLQMIPLDQFLAFLKEVRTVAGQDLDVYEMHLPNDILVEEEPIVYLDVLKHREYMKGYVATVKEANTSKTVCVAKKKKLESNRKQKLLIKFYAKADEFIDQNSANRVLPLKEPINNTNIPLGCPKGSDVEGILTYKMNLLRCEMELREDNLPFTTIDQMIEAIKNGTFQDIIESTFKIILMKSVFLKPKETSCMTLNTIAIDLMKKSSRNYKTMFANKGMDRAYNYFKKIKEVVTRESDYLFEELKEKLVDVIPGMQLQN